MIEIIDNAILDLNNQLEEAVAKVWQIRGAKSALEQIKTQILEVDLNPKVEPEKKLVENITPISQKQKLKK